MGGRRSSKGGKRNSVKGDKTEITPTVSKSDTTSPTTPTTPHSASTVSSASNVQSALTAKPSASSSSITIGSSSFEVFYSALSTSAYSLFQKLPVTGADVDVLWNALPPLATTSQLQRNAQELIVDRVLHDICVELANAEPQMIQHAIDAVFIFSDRGYASKLVSHDILEALMDLQTLERADHLFAYMEKSQDKFKKDMGKGITLLRICNELLRRASKNIHTVLCGRILVFLSTIFPLDEKSGLNLKGEYNTGNITVFDSETPAPENLPPSVSPATHEGEEEKKNEISTEDSKTIDSMDVDQKMEKKPQDKAVSSSTVKSPGFYTIFWSLQRLFSNPPSIFDHSSTYDLPILEPEDDKKPTNLSFLKTAITKTLDRFSETSRREKELAGSESTKEGKSVPDANHDKEEEQFKTGYFFPKFLTSSTLLDQEIDDPDFRRQILIQILMVLSFLIFHTTEERAKWVSASTLRASPYVLLPADEQWVQSLWTRATNELKNTPPDGERFAQTVTTVIERDKNWVLWKIQSCPTFEKKPLDPSLSEQAKAGIKNGATPLKPFPHRMGTEKLTKIWEKELEDYDAGDAGRTWREFKKPTEVKDFSYFVKASNGRDKQILRAKSQLEAEGNTLDPGKKAAVGAKIQNVEEIKLALNWRAFRLAASNKLHLFSRVTDCDVNKLATIMQEEEEGTLVSIGSKKATTAAAVARKQSSMSPIGITTTKSGAGTETPEGAGGIESDIKNKEDDIKEGDYDRTSEKTLGDGDNIESAQDKNVENGSAEGKETLVIKNGEQLEEVSEDVTNQVVVAEEGTAKDGGLTPGKRRREGDGQGEDEQVLSPSSKKERLDV